MVEYIAYLNTDGKAFKDMPAFEYDQLVSHPMYTDLTSLYKSIRYGMLKDSRPSLSYTVYKYQAPENRYVPVSEFHKRGGRLVIPFALIKYWRDMTGKTFSLKEWYKATDVCPECKGNKCAAHTYLRGNFIAGDACTACKGAGTYVHVPDKPKPKDYQLVVRDHIYSAEGVGYTHPDFCVESGSDVQCLKTYVELRPSYPADTQFRIESEGMVVAIEASESMLWLDRIPNPRKYQK